MAKLGDLGWPAFALAFRGFNTTNLGRTAELLACPAYAATVRTRLEQAGSVASDVLGRPVELVARVKRQQEASLADYAEAVALVFATEMAQMDLLSEHHGCTTDTAELVFWLQPRRVSRPSLQRKAGRRRGAPHPRGDGR